MTEKTQEDLVRLAAARSGLKPITNSAARERLPARWVELIKHLNEQERARERVQNAERKWRETPRRN